MSKILVIFGASGQQGGSIVKYVLNVPELSKQFNVRAIMRNPSSSSGQSLEKMGVEVIKADLDEPESLQPALSGAHTVFGFTYSAFDEHLKSREVRQGKGIADAAVAAGAQYFIWSTTVNVARVSSGKLARAGHMDSKAEVEEYIRTLPIKSSFFGPGLFMQNYLQHELPRPYKDGTYAIYNCVAPDTLLPLIETVGDTGKYVGAILADPDKYEGKYVACATGLYSFDQLAKILGEATGKTVVYKQLPPKVYEDSMPHTRAGPIMDMYLLMQDYGYYGPNTRDQIEWTAKQHREKLTTPQEFYAQNPPKLEG